MSVEVLRERTVKRTQAPFICSVCRRSFEPGVTKYVQCCVNDGEFYEWTTCETCEWMADIYIHESDPRDLYDGIRPDHVIANMGELIGYWDDAWDLVDMIRKEVTE